MKLFNVWYAFFILVWVIMSYLCIVSFRDSLIISVCMSLISIFYFVYFYITRK